MASTWFKIDTEKVFNVKQHELGFVKLLFFHNFFQGMGLALFFTAANSIFLSQASVKELPLVYMLAALLLLLIGIIYSYFESRVNVKFLLRFILIFLFVSIILIRVGIQLSSSIWVAFAVIMWYRATSLLNYLEFWGLTSLMLDVRQSKRLFGLISSGEVTAKLIGYFSIPAIKKFIDVQDFIIVAALAFLACLYFLNKIINHPNAKQFDLASKHSIEQKEKESIFKKYFKSDFIIMLSVLSFIAIIVFTFIDFSFQSNLQIKYTTKEEIAGFLGLFYGFNKGATFLLKMFFSGRIIDKLGVKNSLLFLPAVFMLVIVGIILYRMISVDETYLFGMFATLLFLMEMLRYAIFEPVFFSLFQPLGKNLRLFGQAIVNGFLNPIALGVAGITLFLLIYFMDSIDLGLVSYILIGILIVWILLVVITNRQYIIVLQNAVKKRYFEGSEITVQGKLLNCILSGKLESIYPEEVIYSAELMFKADNAKFKDIIEKIFYHPSPEVKKYALQKIEDHKIQGLNNQIWNIIETSEIALIKESAIKAYCQVEENDIPKLYHYLEDQDSVVRKGAITGLLKTGALEAVVLAGQQLLNLIQSSNPNDNIIAIRIINDLKIKNFFQPLINFFSNENPLVVKESIIASANSLNPKLIPYLVDFLKEQKYSEISFQSLIYFNNDAVDYLHQYFKTEQSKTASVSQLLRICQVLGNIGGSNAHELLLKLMNFPNAKIQNEAIFALKRSQYKTDLNSAIVKDKFEDQFTQAAWIYNSLYILSIQHKPYERLQKAIEIELSAIKDNLLNILSFTYDTRSIIKAREGLLNDYSERKANALEIIDNLISKKLYTRLSLIFEDLSLEERAKKFQSLHLNFPTEMIAMLEIILKEKDLKFNRWTQVSAIISILDFISKELTSLILPYLEDNNKLLNEAAINTLYRINNSSEIELDTITGTIDNNKLKIMMEKNSENRLLDIEKVIILKSTSLFTETPENILVDIANIIREERVEENQKIFQKGDMGFCMYVISEGEVRIHDNDLTFIMLKNRDFFGELALLDPEPRSASATATKDTLLLRLDQEAFYELMSERMEVAKGILKVLCKRLRNQNDVISDLKKKTGN